MPQTKAKQEPTVDTIAPADLWEEIADGVNTIGHDEGVFEFGPDAFRVVVKDAANVALIKQEVDATDFESYDVDDYFAIGINTQRFEDVLGKVDDVPVRLSYDWNTYKFDIQADDVDYHMAGLDADSVNGSPADIPPVKDADDLPGTKSYCVDVTLPVDKLDRASGLVDMVTSIAHFNMGGDDGIFVIEGPGDTDSVTVDVHESDAFEWREDPPESVELCKQSNNYLQDVVGLIDEDTVRVVTGPGLPYHLWTKRADGRIDTKVMQAPRVDNSK